MAQACDLRAHPPTKKKIKTIRVSVALACKLRAHAPLKKEKKKTPSHFRGSGLVVSLWVVVRYSF